MPDEAKKKPPAHEVLIKYISNLVTMLEMKLKKITDHQPWNDLTYSSLREQLATALTIFSCIHVPADKIPYVKTELEKIRTNTQSNATFNKMFDTTVEGLMIGQAIGLEIEHCIANISE